MTKLTHVFVKNVPEKLEAGIIYVSIEYATVIHKCCCGCGNEVVTPLSPKDWQLTFDGESVSLRPSIGNWNFKCQSHYIITKNRVEWCPKWDDKLPAKETESDLTVYERIRREIATRLYKRK